MPDEPSVQPPVAENAPNSVGFLISQLGFFSSKRFAEALAPVGIAPKEFLLLRFVAASSGQSQQALAQRLGVPPSRMVALVDDLEERGLVERRRSQTDRRNHELYVAADAGDRLRAVLAAVGEHDTEMTRGLTAKEKQTLAELLAKMAKEQGLDGDVHPAYGSRKRGERT